MEIVTIVRVVITVMSFVCFVAWLVWFLNKDNKAYYDARAQDLIDDDDRAPAAQDAKIVNKEIK
jgi:cbb3-type cytochrome oxidase subunit 3